MHENDPFDPTGELATVPDPGAPVSLGRRRALGLLAGAGLAAVGGIAALTRNGGGGSGATDVTLRRATTTSTTGASTTSTTAGTTTTAAAAESGATATTTKTSSSSGSASGGSSSQQTTTTTAKSTTTGTGAIGAIPQETAGPYPADGTNGPNVLTQSGIVRRDIRSSFGSGSGLVSGVPLTIELTVVDHATGNPLPGYAVYLWHCSPGGEYSLYSQGATDANWLRGVQAADGNGVIRFTSVFPGDYSGRWPHIHFEVFNALAQATTGRNAVRTSQLALPQATCQAVYANGGSAYAGSAGNLASESLSSDMVFADGVDLQLATMSGSVADGYTAKLVVGI